MIKHICICDRCGYETNMEETSVCRFEPPINWKRFGSGPKYLFCPTCSAYLDEKIRDLTYIVLGNKNKRILIQAVEK